MWQIALVAALSALVSRNLVSTSSEREKNSDSSSSLVNQISYYHKPITAASEVLLAPQDLYNSYVIENTRFVETFSIRCKSSTILQNPTSVEPSFVLLIPNSEQKVKATASMEKILAAGFLPSQRTTIFVHGYKQSYVKAPWIDTVRGIFKEHSLVGRMNIIFMDWGPAASGPYPRVAARASAMGAFLANFLMKLINLGADRNLVHIIGHSLGAHVAGFAGKRIQPRIGRITGLDPAGPCFGKISLNSPDDRLSANDAQEVDVYHYNDAFLGLPDKMGQFEVVVNGGEYQPGCPKKVHSLAKAAVHLVLRKHESLSKSHTRATDIATTTIANQCQMVAYQCESWLSFQLGECGYCDQNNNQCFSMDFHYQFSNKLEPELPRQGTGMRFFISTGEYEPYCLHHYQIVVKLSETKKKSLIRIVKKVRTSNFSRYKIHVQLTNTFNERANFVVTNQMRKNVFTHLLLKETMPNQFKTAFVNLHRAGSLRFKPNRISLAQRLEFLEVNYMSNFDPEVRKRFSTRLCPVQSTRKANSIYGSEESGWLKLIEC